MTAETPQIHHEHFLTMLDYTKEELEAIIQLADKLKIDKKNGIPHPLLEGKTLAMIFEKSSTRTRVSFEAGMYQLGGNAIFLSKNDIQMGRGESISDTAKVLSRYADGIMIRAHGHAEVEELARCANVPVINGLTDDHHPCQVLADLMTIRERFGDYAGRKLVYVGDGNNMAHSLMIGCAIIGMDCAIVTPSGYEPKEEIVAKARDCSLLSGASIVVGNDPFLEIENADAVYSDVWASMGWEEEADMRKKSFTPYRVTAELMAKAKPEAIYLHCLPAHRGEEVDAEVIDGPQSVVFDQAENRLHVQKALLAALLV